MDEVGWVSGCGKSGKEIEMKKDWLFILRSTVIRSEAFCRWVLTYSERITYVCMHIFIDLIH